MDINRQVQILQNVYAGALADVVLQYEKQGVLEEVTQRKRTEQMASGALRAAQFGITKPEEVFVKLSDLFNCAQWDIVENPGGGFTAEAAACKLCAIARKIGAPSPCLLYCLDPMEGLVKAVEGNAVFTVKETLWQGSKCAVEVIRAGG